MFVVTCGYQSLESPPQDYADTSHYDGPRNSIRRVIVRKAHHRRVWSHLPAVDLKRKVAASSVRRTPIKTAVPQLNHMIPHLAQRSMSIT